MVTAGQTLTLHSVSHMQHTEDSARRLHCSGTRFLRPNASCASCSSLSSPGW